MAATAPDRRMLAPNFIGCEAYDRFMVRLEKALKKRGVTVRNRTHLIEYALNVLGVNHGLKAPARVLPVGTNRHGRPKKNSENSEGAA